MQLYRSSIAILLLLTISGATQAQQIGPEIRIGPGEATIGGVGVRNGGIVVPTLDQAIDTAINTSPLVVLSDADKKNVHQAIKTVGFVSAVLHDPVTGLIIISVLNGKGEKQNIPVPINDATPTGNTWPLAAKCIVQQEGGLITAMFADDPAHITEATYGDTLKLTANYCAEYKEKSATAVSMKMTGRSDFPNAAPPLYRHYLVGAAN